ERTVVRGTYVYEKVRESLTRPSLSEKVLADELRQFWPGRDMFFKKFAAFEAFLEQHGLPKGGYYVQPLEVNGMPLEILGVNTAWICDRDNEDIHRELLIGVPQLDDLDRRLGSPSCPIRIALMHHPPEALHPSDRSFDRLAGMCPIILHGHLHTARA